MVLMQTLLLKCNFHWKTYIDLHVSVLSISTDTQQHLMQLQHQQQDLYQIQPMVLVETPSILNHSLLVNQKIKMIFKYKLTFNNYCF